MPVTESIRAEEFSALMAAVLPDVQAIKRLGVAVSGGADSLALVLLLSDWAASRNIKIHALTVDHGLRKESKSEAAQVNKWLKPYKNITHETLVWQGVKPKTKISETARTKRYELLITACKKHRIEHLFVAHHLNDQAETFLLRLAHGSGLDGLAGMLPVQNRDDVYIVRPLLSVSHDRLVATLKSRKQKWIDDPTNKKTEYARPRLRAAEKVLGAEGLTPERLATTAARLARGRQALEAYAEEKWAAVECDKKNVVVRRQDWDAWPDDIQVRILTRMLGTMTDKSVPARMEQIEHLVDRLREPSGATIRITLGGCVVTRGAKTIKVGREGAT